MHKYNHCDNCKLEVSDDLNFCPLCGKFLGQEGKKPNENESSFPVVDMSYIYRQKWVKIVQSFMVLIGILCVVINLMFITKPLWFPYVLAGLFVVWQTIFHSFKYNEGYIKRIPETGFWLALFVVFIDVYDHLCLDIALGWAIEFAAPSILTLTVLVTTIISLFSAKYDLTLFKKVVYLSILAVLYLLSKWIFFNHFSNWPLYMNVCVCLVSIFLMWIFKNKKLKKGMNRSFHI